MASQSIPDKTRVELDNLLKQWSMRWRLRQVILYLPRIVIAMSVMSVLVAVVITLFSLLPAVPMLFVSGIAMGVTFILITGGIGFWRKDTQEVARQFDALFDSHERLSTAFELLDGRIQTGQEIAERQLQDTYEFAKTVDARKRMPLKVKWVEWIVALFVILLTIGILLFSAFTLTRRANAIGEATQAATNEAAEITRDITGEIATDTDLTEEERNSLLESSEMALSELENPENTAEDSFVAMSELESDLREQAESIGDSTEASNEAMNSAMDALNGQQQIPEENPGEALAQELSELAEQAGAMSEEEQEALSEALQEAAEALREQNEALANSLEQASDALQSNQSQQAQESLNQASEQAESVSQENQARSETSEALREAANEARDAAQEIAEAEQQDSENQESEQGQEGQEQESDPQQPGPEGLPGQQDQQAQDGQSGEDGQQGEEGQASQPGEEGQAGEEGQNGEEGQDGQDGQSDQPGDSANSELSEQGGGAGNSSSDNDTQDISGREAGPINASNEGDGGEVEYEPVFAPPPFTSQAGDTNVELETDDSSASTIEGDFQENPDGESTIPYNQVFSTYADAANSALENGYVPLGVRDVVRDYFTSIEPTGNQAGE